jgi:hypothetical protein
MTAAEPSGPEGAMEMEMMEGKNPLREDRHRKEGREGGAKSEHSRE